jgi:RecG-like helicase
VCPLVSESSSDTLAGVKAAEEEYERLVSSRVFDAHGCGLLHGKMKQQEKEAVLAKFNRWVVATLPCTCLVLSPM